MRQQLGWPQRLTRESMTPAEYGQARGIDPSYDLPRPKGGGRDQRARVDGHAQTLLFADQLERKLSGIREGARTALSEMGVNILYAAFGYLEWYESEASDLKLFAPLLLHPLAMERTLVRQTYRYSIASIGDDSEINLTLKERLLRDFGLMLPEFGDEGTPEQYLAKAEEAIREMRRWRVRRFVTVGLFPFSRLVMYHDLDPERWPEQKALHRHPVLVELLGGSDRSQALYAADYEVDRPEIAAKVPLLITDADASQFSAIVDVMDGKHLAIKGPPGTGKSQTITNLIAAALAKGLTVLFLAEKMAALEVVKKRLDEAGLGEFCLELHSAKANKKDVLESLRKRLELHRPTELATLQRTIEEYERHRQQLTRYVELINHPFGSSGSSLQQLFWAALRARARARELQVPAGLDEVMLQDALDLTAIDLDRRRVKVPEPLLTWFLQESLPQQYRRLKERVESLMAALRREGEARNRALQMSEFDCQAFFGSDTLDEMPLTAIATRIERALAARDELPVWIEYHRQRDEVEEMGLRPVLKAYEVANARFVHLMAAFEHVFHRAVLHQAYKRYPELQRFSGTTQETARRHFQALDRRIIDLKRQQLTRALARSPITSGRNSGPRREWTGLHLIRHQLTLQQRHIPVRDLLLRAGAAIQQMKPCWMMSPASLAQFVRPGGAEFDLVVIDEASQMRPEEALSAIGRSNQFVVVGDPQQLPPTSFFERIDLPDEDEMQAEDYVDTESILDLALAVFHPARELRWHYRSRHERLIAFSNEHFYGGALVVFPSPLAQHRDCGVEYRAVEGIYTPRAGINLPEAQAVAEAAVQFMATYPNRSLGLVTMNQAQGEILTDEMDRLFARDSHAEAYRKRWQDTLEPFFVKNLENVQGDERDVIFISTVYGPEQSGGRVAQRFGPINAAAGHRRLNVLFTRAKEKVVIFSSMQPADVIPTATSRRGVVILKHYLEYALSGRLDSGMATGREPDSDFEVFVAPRLRRDGLEVVPQVGVAGYFIDLAVKDPGDSQRYLLGIECDGASYHSAKSARDRDRLRQEILEQKGWRLYRIWSTDWFNDPEREAKKLLRHLHTLTGSQWPG